MTRQKWCIVQQYALNSIPDTINTDIQNNKIALRDAKAITTVNDTEFAKSEIPLSDQVEAYFNSINNNAYNDVIGDVELNARSIKDDLAHGIGRVKAITFKVVPDVISKGKIVAYEKNWKNRNYDSVVIAAPVNVRDSNGVDTEYMVGIIAKRDDSRDMQRFYVHEALLIKKDELLFKTRGVSQGNQKPSNSSSSIYNILQEIVNGKSLQKKETTQYSISTDNQGRTLSKEQQDYFKDTKVVDDNGNLLVIYHGTRKADFTVFKRNQNFFTDSKEMANSYAPTGEMHSG